MSIQQGNDQRRSALSELKRALLRERLQGRGRATGSVPPASIPKRPPDADGVLSFAQQRLWFLDRLVLGSPFYTESSALRIQEALSVPAFKRALNEIVGRHEVLRTTFPLVGDQPRAVVSPGQEMPLELRDVTVLPAAQRESEVLRLATLEARRPFDLERGPMLRAMLLRLGFADWVFLLSLHHIVCDGWSSSVFSRELSEIYSAFVAGLPCPLEELPIQYADFAHWQRSYLSKDVMEHQLGYWRAQLADLPQLELPTDRPRPPVFSYLGGHHKSFLPRTLAQALERLGQGEGATLFITLLAGFNTLLHRYTGQDDLVLGVPVANRNRRELEDLIGFFVNVLVMRNDLSGHPTHREVLRRVRATALDAYAHQDLPFEKLVEDLHPQRDPARNPLFQVIFQLHENPSGSRRGTPESALSLIEVDRSTVKFDLRVDFFPDSGGLRCVIEYSTDLFTPERIVRMGEHLRTVYESMVRDPERGIGDFALVGEAEGAMLAQWGAVEVMTPLCETIHGRFEQQVARNPDAVAVVAPDRSSTYKELDAAASRIAARLRVGGIGPEELVALPAEPTLAAVVAQLAILKAGGAYLPVNASYPDERLRHMLREANVRFLVEIGDARERFGGFDVDLLPLELDLDPSKQGTLAGPAMTPDHLAYVMYTSGSTGTPKGICVTHRAVVRLVTDANYCSMGPGETFLLLAPLTFDAATFEIWAPLLNGGRLVIYPERRFSPEDLRRTIATHGVTSLWLTAGLFHEIVDSRPDALAGVRQLLAGGDVLSPRHVRAQLERCPGCRIVNGYGPTENTTFTCCHALDGTATMPSSVPIGRPITRTYVRVMDPYNHLAPIGVPGELCAGGDGLARCYLNDPALTAERFIPDPFSATPRRLYRTGDRVRFLPTGELEFVGRIDRQLKIRGFRVEPGEIEKAIVRHPAVRDAIVLAREGPNGEKRLTAYVVPGSPDAAGDAQQMWQQAEMALTENWRTLYDDLYGTRADEPDSDFDIVGWKASDTGEPVPASEMREWLESTVERISQGGPARILEIGCGTGLLAYRLVPHSRFFLGTDISSVVIERLRRGLERVGYDSSRFRLLARPADRFEGIDRHAFDVVVINSVVQYFPGFDYLLRVLEGAVESAAPGGRIFIGDIRSLPHLAPFHAGVELARAGEGIKGAELVRRLEKAMQLEQELVIDTAFFEALPSRIPRITHVDVQWKRGRAKNEQTRYRYDVVLHVQSTHQRVSSTLELHWYRDGLSIGKLREILGGAGDDLIVVHGVPNRRILDQVRWWRQLGEGLAARTISGPRSTVGGEHPDVPDLEEFWTVAEGTRYVGHVGPDGAAPETCLVRYVLSGENASRPLAWPLSTAGSRPCREYTNTPMRLGVAEQLVPRVRSHLQQLLPEYMIPSGYVVLASLPLTRNGKVDRAALLRLGTEPPAVTTGFVAGRDQLERRLAGIWARMLGVDRVGIHDNFFELGGDSILCIQVVSRAAAENIHITVKQIFENQTIAQLASVAAETPVVHADQGPVVGPARLTLAQAWLLEQNLPRVDHFNQSILLEVPRTLDPSSLDRALRTLVRHHDALRLRFERRGGAWQASYAPPEDRVILERHDLGRLECGRRAAELERHCASIQAGLNIGTSPVFRAVLYDLGPAQGSRLLLAAHHLVVDGVSWRILLEDLWTAYGDCACGREPALPAKTTSLQDWARTLSELAESYQLREEMDYWLRRAPSQPGRLPVDHGGPNTVASVQVVREELSEDETQAILTEIPQNFRTQVNDVLLTALARTLARWTGDAQAYFDLEGHGREPLSEDVDLSRTVGWFTSIFPVRLEVDPADDITSGLLSVRSQLQAIPRRGVGYGVLRFLSPDPHVRESLRAIPRRELSFNYLGQFGRVDGAATIRGAVESPGPLRDPGADREYLIEIDGSVAWDRLVFRWSYSRARHERTTIEGLARNMMAELRSIIQCCRPGETAGVTSGHFQAARIDQDDLQRLLAKLQRLDTSEP